MISLLLFLCVVSSQGTIKARLLSMKYTTPEAFAADVRLVFNNAIGFNPQSHFVHTWAVHLLNEFDVSLSKGERVPTSALRFRETRAPEAKSRTRTKNVVSLAPASYLTVLSCQLALQLLITLSVCDSWLETNYYAAVAVVSSK